MYHDKKIKMRKENYNLNRIRHILLVDQGKKKRSSEVWLEVFKV